MLKKLLLLSTLLFGLLTVQAQNTWYLEDFEELGILGPNAPTGWEVSENGYSSAFSCSIDRGVDGSQAFYTQLGNSTERYFITQSLNLGDEPVVEFQYMTLGIIGEPEPHCLTFSIALSIEDGEFATVKTVSAEDFVASSTYATMKVILDKDIYADKYAKVKLSVSMAGEDGSSFYIDNFGVGTKPEAAANDLMIQGAISGSTMPIVNTEAGYTFTVFNNGSADQAAYSVQLLNGTRSLLASENVTTAIAAGATAQHTLKYTPVQTGADKLYAVVVLAGDEDRTNDTATLAIDVQTAGNTVVEVGKGGLLTNGKPLSFCSPTSIALSLYSPEEVNALRGTISAVVFEGKFSQEITLATQVYIGETDHESIPFEQWNAKFIDVTTLTKVFDGNMTFNEGDHQSVRFDFAEPFAYSGERTLAVYTFASIAAENVLEDWNANQFYATSLLGGSTMVISTEGENIDPMKPNEQDAWAQTQRPNTKFIFSSVSDEKYMLSFDVKDAAGKAISGAVITLNGEKQEAGQYVFENTPERLYSYVVEKEGYIPARGSLRLGKDTTVAVALTNMADFPGLSGYLFEDFENISQGKRPLNWTGDFYVDEKGGQNDGHRLTHSFFFLDGPRYITTNPVFMGSEPVFEFEYRVMNLNTNTNNLEYTGTAFNGENMTWMVEVSEDFGETWSMLYSQPYGMHIESEYYTPFSWDVSDYAGKICQFKITVNRDYNENDAFYFDIDNLKIGTQLTNDLAVVSKIEGLRVSEAGTKTAYTVCVRNEGTAAAENYSLKFYDGETELGSVAGTKLESGAFAKLTFEHTFAEAGEYTLTAQCVMEADELTLNNATSEFYVSVQPEGVRSSMVEAYEGENIAWYAPVNVFDYYSLSWILYNQDDLTLEAGDNISGMAFRTKFETATDRMHLTIYIGETNSSHFMWSAPVPTSLTKVFDGVASIEAQDGGNFVINFDRAFPYTGKNLVVAIYKESSQAFSIEEDLGFYGYYNLGYTTVLSVHSEQPIDLPNMDLDEEQLRQAGSFTQPSTIFLLNDNVSYHAVNFEVTDQNGREVNNATVTFDGQTLETGVYKVEDVPDGTYTYTASLGDETVGGEVTVNGADATVKVQFQHVANENLKENMIRIYPNPTTDKLHIDVAEGAKEINLYDISGRTVRKLSRVPAGVIEMDLSDCHSGLYLLTIDSKAFKVSKR